MIAPLHRALPLALVGLLAAGTLAAQPVVNLPAADRPLAGAPAALFAVGREEGRSWEMLSNVEAAAFDAQDNLYVLDRGNHRVLVFDRAGRFLREIGEEGDGPGELRVPVSMALAADGTLTVADLAQRRFNLFQRDGTFLRSVPFDDETGVPMGTIAAHPAGGVVGIFRAVPLPSPTVQGPRSGTFAVPASTLLRLPLAGSASPVRFHRFADASRGQQTVSGGPSGGTVRMQRFTAGPPVFGPQQLWGVLPDGGVALANGTGYNLRLLNAAGQPARTLRRPLRTRLVTEADRERARDRRREQMRSGTGAIVISAGDGGGGPRSLPPEMIEEQVRSMRFADTVAVLRSLLVAPSGTLWIGRAGPQGDDDGPIDLVTAAGRYRGTLPRGERMPLAVSAGGRAAYLERDELEVERVVVRQLPTAWR